MHCIPFSPPGIRIGERRPGTWTRDKRMKVCQFNNRAGITPGPVLVTVSPYSYFARTPSTVSEPSMSAALAAVISAFSSAETLLSKSWYGARSTPPSAMV